MLEWYENLTCNQQIIFCLCCVPIGNIIGHITAPFILPLLDKISSKIKKWNT